MGKNGNQTRQWKITHEQEGRTSVPSQYKLQSKRMDFRYLPMIFQARKTSRQRFWVALESLDKHHDLLPWNAILQSSNRNPRQFPTFDKWSVSWNTSHDITNILCTQLRAVCICILSNLHISGKKKSTCFTNQNSSVIIQGMSSLEFTMIPDILMLQSPTLLTQWHFCCPPCAQSFSFCFAGRRRSSCADAADSHGGEPAVPLFFQKDKT